MLQRTATVLALAGAILWACGCQAKPADDASVPKRPQGTANLMDAVAKAPEYHPPVDGRLTEAQVKMYLDVRQREQQIREAAFKKRLEIRPETVETPPADSGQDKPAYVEVLQTVGDQPDVADIATADLR